MKKLVIELVFLIALTMVACQDNSPQAGYLQGQAEGLWNEEINLATYNRGVTIINPFSPSICGYCFFDGDFIRENYYKSAIDRGDSFLGMSLFNPQRDIYTFQKHYRKDAQVITSPISLHKQYHDNGFPWVTIVKDGEKKFQGVMVPYDFLFDSLTDIMWPDDPPLVRPTSPLHMADKFISENKRMRGLKVIPDNDTLAMNLRLQSAERIKQRYVDRGREYHPSYETKYESDLSEADLLKNIGLIDMGGMLRFDLLRDQDVPIRISEKSISIGDFTFVRDDVELNACFPNPYDQQKYIMLTCIGKNVRQRRYMNYVDYLVTTNRADGAVEVLLYGHFDKSGETWKFDTKQAVMSASIKNYCSEKQCPLPIDQSKTRHLTTKDLQVSKVIAEKTGLHGQSFTVGGKACRFPSIAVDNKGISWVTWEEAGDILLTSVNLVDQQKSYLIEGDSSDSFDPVIAVAGDDLWVFYLNDIEGYYRLYGRYLNNGRLSAEIALSDRAVCDAITPAVVSDGNGKLVIAWSEWRANNKQPMYRIIENRVLGEIKAIFHKAAGDESGYVCAWDPALAIDETGNIRGAWNQHYPATFAVYSGDLDSEPVEIGEGDIGGYPAVIYDKDNVFWVFWETYLWERSYGDKPQSVMAAFYDEELGRFSMPVSLSNETQTVFNQTPCAAVDSDGTMFVAWSGRASEVTDWRVQLVSYQDGIWSEPVAVSSEGEHARAPSITISEDNIIWLTWHAGTGDNMKIKILKYEAS